MSSTSGRQADLASLAHHSTPHESQRPFRVEHIVSYPHHYGPALTANHRIYPAHPCVQRVPPSHRMVVSALSALFERCPDVVVATSPQFFCAIAGWAVSVATRRPFVFELRDLWPASIVAVGAMRRSVVIRALERVEMFLYRRATAIVAVTESFRRELIARGVDGKKIHVVVNGVDATQYHPRPRSPALEADLELQGKFVAGYLGTHGLAHALDKVVEAAALLSQREDIVFLFVGGGADRARVEAMVAERKLENVVMLARQPKERMAEIWSLCDVALIPLRDAPVFKTVIPSKIFECMGMGIPILMSLPEGEATGIVRTMECGVCVPPENPAAMAAAIERLAGSPQDRQRLAIAARAAAPMYSRDALAASMLGVLEAKS